MSLVNFNVPLPLLAVSLCLKLSIEQEYGTVSSLNIPSKQDELTSFTATLKLWTR